MLLPTKTLSPARCLLGLGASILTLLTEPKPVSKVWDDYKRARANVPNSPTVTFSWFVLALDVLYAARLIQFDHNRLVRVANAPTTPPGQ